MCAISQVLVERVSRERQSVSSIDHLANYQMQLTHYHHSHSHMLRSFHLSLSCRFLQCLSISNVLRELGRQYICQSSCFDAHGIDSLGICYNQWHILIFVFFLYILPSNDAMTVSTWIKLISWWFINIFYVFMWNIINKSLFLFDCPLMAPDPRLDDSSIGWCLRLFQCICASVHIPRILKLGRIGTSVILKKLSMKLVQCFWLCNLEVIDVRNRYRRQVRIHK
jgi:hypothetical protein